MTQNKLIGEIKIPEHLAIIMDGNGRWAKSRLMPRMTGHKQGFFRMLELIEHAIARGVKFVTVYALSTENLKSPSSSAFGLFKFSVESA